MCIHIYANIEFNINELAIAFTRINRFNNLRFSREQQSRVARNNVPEFRGPASQSRKGSAFQSGRVGTSKPESQGTALISESAYPSLRAQLSSRNQHAWVSRGQHTRGSGRGSLLRGQHVSRGPAYPSLRWQHSRVSWNSVLESGDDNLLK